MLGRILLASYSIFYYVLMEKRDDIMNYKKELYNILPLEKHKIAPSLILIMYLKTYLSIDSSISYTLDVILVCSIIIATYRDFKYAN